MKKAKTIITLIGLIIFMAICFMLVYHTDTSLHFIQIIFQKLVSLFN